MRHVRYLLPLIWLLGASCAFAAQRNAPQGNLSLNPPLAVYIGEEPSGSVQGVTAVTLYDSHTGGNLTGAEAPRTVMGMPFIMDAVAGSYFRITSFTIYLAKLGTETRTYQHIRAGIRLWDDWSVSNDPVFSNNVLPGQDLFTINIDGPITLQPGVAVPIMVNLSDPVLISGPGPHGFVIQYQGDTGSGFASSEDLTSVVRYGNAPIAAGSIPLSGAFGYRNVSGRSDFNFVPSDASSLGAPNEALAFKLYGERVLFDQTITDFVASPADPIYQDGSFSVSATGGGSGNPVIFSTDIASASVCSAGGIDGSVISILSPGTCVVLADQAGDAGYSAAPQKSLIVEIAAEPRVLVEDGGFEGGFDSAPWAQGSTNRGTPLCDRPCGGVGPRTGDYWVWFDMAGPLIEHAFVEQRGVVPAGSRWLTFYINWSSSIDPPADSAATFEVKLDGNTIFLLTPDNAGDYHDGYAPVSLDISAYADGALHTLRFEANGTVASSATDLHLDDISIEAGLAGDTIFADGFE